MRINKRATDEELKVATEYLDNILKDITIDDANKVFAPLGTSVLDGFVLGIVGRASKMKLEIEWELETREDWKRNKERLGFV